MSAMIVSMAGVGIVLTDANEHPEPPPVSARSPSRGVLCRRHGIAAHSSVVTQAKQHKWAEKREAYGTKASEACIRHHAERMAAREAEVRDQALEAIAEALEKCRSDLKATKSVRLPDGSITEEPAWRMTPKDFAILIDRLLVLFERPSSISQHQGLSVTSELSAESLREFIELTRGRAVPPTSPPPRRRLDD